MKKTLALLLALALCLALCACGETAEAPAPAEEPAATAEPVPAEEETGVTGLANPVVEVTEEEMLNTIGLVLTAPENAADTRLSVIAGEMAQLDFTLDGVKYCYRAQPSAELATYDMSGLYYEWTSTESATVAGREAVLTTTENESCVYWLDVAPGVNYTLCTTESGDGAALLAVAETLFAPVQGEVDGET